MSYENIKTALTEIVSEAYKSGAQINDIRAAIFAAELMAKQIGAIELSEIVKAVGYHE